MPKSFKEIREDVAANSAGAGHIAGIGVGPRGEPGIKKKTGRKMLRRKTSVEGIGECSDKRILPESKEDGSLSLNVPVFIRCLEIAREKLKSDDELHIFVEKIMDLNAATITMDDVVGIFKKYSD